MSILWPGPGEAEALAETGTPPASGGPLHAPERHDKRSQGSKHSALWSLACVGNRRPTLCAVRDTRRTARCCLSRPCGERLGPQLWRRFSAFCRLAPPPPD